MHVQDGTVVLSPSDLTGYLACEHLVELELAATRGDLTRPTRDDPALELVARRGLEHERVYLERLEASGLRVAKLSPDSVSTGWTAAAAQTVEAMKEGVDVIYQGTFFDGRWVGLADFLRRVDTPSALGAFSYEVEDTKLARTVRASALLQTCAYSEHVERIQGVAPRQTHVVLGSGERHSFPLADFSAYYRAVKRRFEDAVAAAPRATYPEPVHHCAVCRWNDACEARRRRDDHLSLVAGIRGDQRRKLAAAGLATLTALADAPRSLVVPDMGAPTLQRLRDQARLQARGRNDGTIRYELLPPSTPGFGLGSLPEPTPEDVFFDMEGDPFVGQGGLEYLFGAVEVRDGEPACLALWAHTATEEKRAFEQFVDFVIERLERNSAMHVYHYASYEETALKRLMGRHATREDEVDRLLRGGVLIDLHRIVRQSVRVSAESYSLKELEPLYMPARAGEVQDAASSIVAYEKWLEIQDDAILSAIGDYNRTDCISTWKLRDWLEAKREEARQQFGREVPRPAAREQQPSDALTEVEHENQRLIGELLRGLPDEQTAFGDAQRAKRLLAHLLGWHRREAKSEWWAYFNRLEMTEEELLDDPEAIAGLSYVGEVAQVKQSVVHRYRFDPAQDFKIFEGDKPVNPTDETRPGEVVALDADAGSIDLKRGRRSSVTHPRCLIPGGPIQTNQQREAIRRVASWVVQNGIDSPGPYRAVRDLLLRRPPRVSGSNSGVPLLALGEELLDGAKRLASGLDTTTLAIQGPPGSGKTRTGARLIVELVRAGKRIGVTANSHKVIDNLLAEVLRHGGESGVAITAVHKVSEEGQAELPGVTYTQDKSAAVDAARLGRANVIGGTSWLFAEADLEGTLDYLFVDEAGQLSLGNAVAVGTAARNLVLLGDPRQLAQPSRGIHPPGSGVSALEHLLGDHQTIPPDRGIFLDETWRMHPTVCRFISEIAYEGRLRSATSCGVQSLGTKDGVGGVGLSFLPVEHRGNRTSSEEEARQVANLVRRLIGLPWTDSNGNCRAISLPDILVVAPFNLQVDCLRRALPAGARVGTVDKFQGQQAPVVIYSMATSDPEQVPRGLDFLFSLNRLNVAISRAHGLAVLVCSPALRRIICQSPEQMRLLNAHARLLEVAETPQSMPD